MLRLARLSFVLLALGLASAVSSGEAPIRSEKPNTIAFPPQEARFVRMVITGTSNGAQACVDELEVYGPTGDRNLALASNGAKASASSLLGGYAAHAVEHLNDGEYGNARSWIPATTGEEWAQIELPAAATIAKVVFSRDRNRQYGDRVPTQFEVRLSLDGDTWATVRRVSTTAIDGSTGAGGPAPLLPNPPPPPQLSANGKIATADAAGVVEVPKHDALGFENLALREGAKASASSVYSDGALPIHQIAHLNDGLADNSHSWISKGEPSWAEIDLGDTFWVYVVALGNDGSGRYRDRAALTFSILTATEHNTDSNARTWRRAVRNAGTPLLERTEFRFKPVQARYVRVVIESANDQARLDEIEVYGQQDEIPLGKIGPLPDAGSAGVPGTARTLARMALLRYAFIGEEHAWLKTYGRADLDPSLVPYNGRVTEYPRHVGDDRLPLPPLSSAPVLDGTLDDACWSEASQGIVRVSKPDDFDAGPLVEQSVLAGRSGTDLCLAIRVNRLLSSHLAVVSSADWSGCGIVAITPDGLAFNTYEADANRTLKLKESAPLSSAFSPDLKAFELRLPLALFPSAESRGLRLGLGLGGRHTPAVGRPVEFVFSPLSIAQAGPCVAGRFLVRLALPGTDDETQPYRVSLSVPEVALSLKPGESQTLSLPATTGPLGPECNLELVASASSPMNAVSETFSLHLLRYDPLQRTLDLMAEMADRLDHESLDVTEERGQLLRLNETHTKLLSAAPDPAAERQAFFDARLAKRRLFLRAPDLAPIESLLFVKRHAYHPSHIYTDYTDAPFRPGGGVYRIDIPRVDGRFEPDDAKLTCLFESGGGIARDPVATFDLSTIYFGYRPAADGFFHLMRVAPDGSGLVQLTDGPYHDFYPCPLPDGGLAFITTRCTARVFCFRWTSSVLFRMNPDGTGMRPLSYSSLSEWAPSVMSDGRLIWTRWEYIDKGADFSQTLWSINPDGTSPELVFGNTIIQPNGYACGREVPGTSEILCTLVSHFGDINGPIALLDLSQGRLNQKAIRSLTPEVPWPGMWPATECFRDPVPLSKDYFLCSHAPLDRFGLYAIDRYGNRELLHLDSTFGSMAPTPFRVTQPPPALPDVTRPDTDTGRFVMLDVYRGLEPTVPRGSVKWLRVVEEVRHNLTANPNFDHADFMKWYASPVDIVSGPFGWPTYTAKAPLGLVPVEEDGSASFVAPAGKVLYFQALDKDYNELQRMRSVVQLQPGETRSCVGCHDARDSTPPPTQPLALSKPPHLIAPHPWGDKPFSYSEVVQPVLDAKCISCHSGAVVPAGRQTRGDLVPAAHQTRAVPPDLTSTLDAERVPASYRALITGGWLHVIDCGFNSAGCEKREPFTFGTVKSKLWPLLQSGHHGVELTTDEMLRLKTWTDLNCPLWPDYLFRPSRPGPEVQVTKAQ
jgi:hypothetical protein